MEQLADPKLLSKAFIVSCGSRNSEGILRNMEGMVRDAGWDTGLECFQEWREQDLDRDWHNW